jgi:hypothetical protein
MDTQEQISFYATPGPLTEGSTELLTLPKEIPDLVASIQNLLDHKLGAVTGETGHLRSTKEIVTELLRLGPLTETRDISQRIQGSCRHFTLLTVAVLRAYGIPARGRCGFDTYYVPGWHGDHWVAEYWTGSRWCFVDAQLRPELRLSLGIDFEATDIPRDRFVVAGEAWLQCRKGMLDPAKCGLEGEGTQGLWWIAGNVIRDVAALNKMELLPWDLWGAMPFPGSELSDGLLTLLDHAAVMTSDSVEATEVQELYSNEAFRVPAKVYNFIRTSHEAVFETSARPQTRVS